jgi:hypothetical protein
MYFVCSVCFLLATEALYDLSRKYLKDEYLAYKGRKTTTSKSAKILLMRGQACNILKNNLMLSLPLVILVQVGIQVPIFCKGNF